MGSQRRQPDQATAPQLSKSAGDTVCTESEAGDRADATHRRDEDVDGHGGPYCSSLSSCPTNPSHHSRVPASLLPSPVRPARDAAGAHGAGGGVLKSSLSASPALIVFCGFGHKKMC